MKKLLSLTLLVAAAALFIFQFNNVSPDQTEKAPTPNLKPCAEVQRQYTDARSLSTSPKYDPKYAYENDGMTFFSTYISMQRKGQENIKIAADVYLPTRAVREGHKLPVVLHGTRYNRSFKVRKPFDLLLGPSYSSKAKQWAKEYTGRGYGWVSVDVRGTGASQGSRPHDLTEEEIEDYKEVLDWVMQQSWSNGKVGSFGVSYEGMFSELLTKFDHPALKVVAPISSPYNLYTDLMFPGGLYCSGFTKCYSELVTTLERNQPVPKCASALSGSVMTHIFSTLMLDGVFPVPFFTEKTGKSSTALDRHNIFDIADSMDTSFGKQGEGSEDAYLQSVVKEHEKNWDIYSSLRSLEFSDHDLVEGKSLFDWTAFNILHSPNQQRKNAVAMYNFAGYYDGGIAHSAISRYLTNTVSNYTNHRNRVMIGPWTHGIRKNTDPYRMTDLVCFDVIKEISKYFDYHLKGAPGSSAQDAGLSYFGKPVQYYTIGEGKWKYGYQFPPYHLISNRNMYFSKDFKLVSQEKFETLTTSEADADLWKMNYQATGSGSYSIWDLVKHLYMHTVDTNKLEEYSRNSTSRTSEHVLSYTSAPLQNTIEITGYPSVTLRFKANNKDGAVFVYLIDYDEITDKSSILTQGQLRLIHRKIQDVAAYKVHKLNEEDPEQHIRYYELSSETKELNHFFKSPIPIRTYLKKDAKDLAAGKVEEAVIYMNPISAQVKKGHSIRLLLLPFDVDNFELPSHHESSFATELTIQRSSATPSFVSLPIISSTAQVVDV